jgi:beta-mannosidase
LSASFFLFSCFLRDVAFLRNVEAEVREWVMRLSPHPSVVIWGGNNEVEASLEWYDETRTNPQLYAVDYVALFVETIGRVIEEVSRGV